MSVDVAKSTRIQEAMTKFRNITGVTPRFDGLMSVASQCKVVDMFRLDEDISRKCPDYNNDKCTYKGKPCSMGDAVKKVWGEEALYWCEVMLDVPITAKLPKK